MTITKVDPKARVLEAMSSKWEINPIISNRTGMMHNHTAKILSFLIQDGMVDSRYVVDIQGKTHRYKEYRLVPQQVVTNSFFEDVCYA